MLHAAASLVSLLRFQDPDGGADGPPTGDAAPPADAAPADGGESLAEGAGELLRTELLPGFTGMELVSLLGVIVLGFLLRRLWFGLCDGALKRVTQRTSFKSDEALLEASRKPVGLLILLIALDACFLFMAEALRQNDLGSLVLRYEPRAFTIAVTLSAVWFAFRAIDGVLKGLLEALTDRTESRLDDALVPLLSKSLKIFTLLVAGVSIVQNLGYNVSGLIAGLGLGGAALALASQDVISNLFGSIKILLDQPFGVGDWVEWDGHEGTVETVGFWSTRVRTFAQTQITVPNARLADATINNFSRMPKRRVVQTVGVSYEATAEQMQRIVKRLRELLETHEAVDQEFWLVHFHEFGGSSLNIQMYFFTTTTVWAEWLDAKQDINLKVMGIVEEEGCEVAFPTRTVYLRQDQPPGAVPGGTDTADAA